MTWLVEIDMHMEAGKSGDTLWTDLKGQTRPYGPRRADVADTGARSNLQVMLFEHEQVRP